MPIDQLVYTGYLVIETCPACHIRHGIPDDLRQRALDNHSVSVCCPRGHSWHFTGKTDRQKLEEAQAQLVHTKDQLEASKADAEKLRVTLLRDRDRWAKGMCPCCRRNFPGLAEHVRKEHPDYDISQIKAPVYRCSCSLTFETFRGLRTHQGKMRPDNWVKQSSYYAHLTVVK